MFQPVVVDDLVAFGEDYEEQRAIRQEEGDWAFLNRVEAEVYAEQRQAKPKLAPLARKYSKRLGELVGSGNMNNIVEKRARMLLDDLLTGQTMPWGELDLPYEADSYTGEKFDDLFLDEKDAKKLNTAVLNIEDQWALDFAEVQALVPLVGDADDPIDQLVFTMVQPEPNPTPDTFFRKVIIGNEESLGLRISQEYDDPEMAKLAMIASQYDELDNDDVVYYEDGAIPSVPLQQNEEQELRIVPKLLQDIRGEMAPYIENLKWRKQFMFMQGVSRKTFVRKFVKTVEVKGFMQALRAVATQFEPQYVAAVFMSVQDDEWGVPETLAKTVKLITDEVIPVRAKIPTDFGTLYDFIDMWGEAILEESLEPGGRGYHMTDAQIRAVAEQFEKEIIEEQFVDALPVGKDQNIQLTRSYVRGVFASTGSNPHEAGMRNYRWEKSRIGAIAFERAIANGKTNTEAWRAFWNAGTPVAVNPYGIKIFSPATGETKHVNWGLALWKLRNGELFLTEQSRLKLHGILASNNWGAQLRMAL